MASNSGAEIQKKLAKAALLEQKIKLKEGLPHLYGFPWYAWARKFFESTNTLNLLCAANQISKSSTQIRKCIDWATDVKKWPRLWRNRPLQFWYLYPSKDQATVEFEKKWIPEFLPRGVFKDHPEYGWKEEYRGKDIFALHFNSGVSIYFKTYAQDAQHLQSGTCHAIFCDEELPEELLDELLFRLAATDGYFHMVFTATLGQEFWRQAMEVQGEGERFPDAFKQTISVYDCLKYDDGTDSHWNEGRIKRMEARCRTKQEVQRRIHGRFVKDSGLKYQGFDPDRNTCKGHKLPATWSIYTAVDIGSGGKENHPAGVIFVAVNPEHTQGRVFKGWRGDGVDTTSGDILTKFLELKGALRPVGQYYDHANRDFFNLAQRIGEPFAPAEKSHDIGEANLNTLFKMGALKIHLDPGDPELPKLVQELLTLTATTPKTKAKDDLIDPLRYCVAKIPWDWSSIAEIEIDDKVIDKRELTLEDQRRGTFDETTDYVTISEEIDAWNELYES